MQCAHFGKLLLLLGTNHVQIGHDFQPGYVFGQRKDAEPVELRTPSFSCYARSKAHRTRLDKQHRARVTSHTPLALSARVRAAQCVSTQTFNQLRVPSHRRLEVRALGALNSWESATGHTRGHRQWWRCSSMSPPRPPLSCATPAAANSGQLASIVLIHIWTVHHPNVRRGTTMAFPGLLEGQRNQPKPHADLFPRSWSKLLLTL